METEFEDNVLDYLKLPIEIYIVIIEKHDGLDDNKDVKKTLFSDFGDFISSKIK